MSGTLSLKDKIQVWKATGLDVVIPQKAIRGLEASLDSALQEVNEGLFLALRYSASAKKYHKAAERTFLKVKVMFVAQMLMAVYTVWSALS